jgi:Tol biopolymer transport system component
MLRSALLATAVALVLPAAAVASFPGADGPIVFTGDPAHGDASLFTLSRGSISPFAASTTQQSAPAYSADGRWVAYSQDRNIWISRADGKGTPKQVTDDDANDTDPAFSPDGKRLVFSRGLVGTGDLFVVKVDGTGLRNLSNDPVRIDDEPAWSPQGDRIAYAANPCFTDAGLTPQGGPCVFVMNADGSAKVNLTPEETRPECDPANQIPGSSHAHHSDDPSWSPDGSRIAFTGYFDICAHDSGGASDIWVMNPDGSGKQDLMSDTGTPDEQPAWSPSGKTIAFVSDRDGKRGLFAIPSAGGTVTRLTTGQDTEPDWGRTPKPCVVPQLKGKKLGTARRLLVAAGCTPGSVRRKAGGRKGRVLATKPKAGKSIPAFSRVKLIVGKG